MVRGVTYAVALFFFTAGNVCLAGPLQSVASSSPNFGRISGNEDFMENVGVKQFMEQCPKDPLIQWKMREAIIDFRICIHTTINDLEIKDDAPGFGSYSQARQMAKVMCTVYRSVQPCVQDFMTRMHMCLPDYSVEDVISGYKEAIAIACVNDGRKLAAAMIELAEEDEKCLDQIFFEIETCPETETEYTVGTKNHTLQACSSLKCAKKAIDKCGGEKKTVKELINDGMAAMNRYVPCSSAHGFRPSITLSATALITLIAAHFRRRDSLF